MDLSKAARDAFRGETTVVQPTFQPAPTVAPPTEPADGGIRPPQSHVGHRAVSYVGRVPAASRSSKPPNKPNRSTCNRCGGGRVGHKANTEINSVDYCTLPATQRKEGYAKSEYGVGDPPAQKKRLLAVRRAENWPIIAGRPKIPLRSTARCCPERGLRTIQSLDTSSPPEPQPNKKKKGGRGKAKKK